MIPADVWQPAAAVAALLLTPVAVRVVAAALWEARQQREHRDAVRRICDRLNR